MVNLTFLNLLAKEHVMLTVHRNVHGHLLEYGDMLAGISKQVIGTPSLHNDKLEIPVRSFPSGETSTLIVEPGDRFDVVLGH